MIQDFYKKLLLIFFCLWVQWAYAQNEANTWYFGTKAGIDFSKKEPKALTNGSLSTTEGCATISNDLGKLLFYTDGVQVWNKHHNIMPNGSGLFGNPSATQSGVIVPKPSYKHIYYVFTVDVEGGKHGLCYSIVDMTLDNGLGDITEKNTPLIAPVSEKVTAVVHKNLKDIWIITHHWGSNSFYTYLLTEKGLKSDEVVISHCGKVHSGDKNNSIGVMKASPNGRKLALAIKKSNIFEIFNFDNTTGKVSSPTTLQLEDGSLTYGVEFSSDGSKFYGSAGGKYLIYQFDLAAESVEDSKTVIAKNKQWTGGLQLGPDGKIYVSVYNSKYLGVINYPNRKGESSQYEEEGIFLGEGVCQLGLPTFVQTYFEGTENINQVRSEDGSRIKLGKPFTKNILFEFDKYNILPQYHKELDDLIAYLKVAQHITVKISGHTDNVGTGKKNLTLSENRAKSVAEYIIAKGIAQERISYKGYGEERPINTNNTPEGRAKNRRIEFVLDR